MERIAKIIAIVRDIVWTVLGVLLLASIVLMISFVSSGGLSRALPAALTSGGGSGGGQSGNGSGGAQVPVGQGGDQGSGGPGDSGQPQAQQPGQGQQSSLAVGGSGTFAGTVQGSQFTGKFQVDATSGNPAAGVVSLTMSVPSKSSTVSFMGHVLCVASFPTSPPERIVGGVIRSSTDPAKMPQGSGFVIGLIASTPSTPGQVSFQTGFPLSAGSSGMCINTPLFDSNHPGIGLTSGNITFQ
jgi:hypothetical protein